MNLEPRRHTPFQIGSTPAQARVAVRRPGLPLRARARLTPARYRASVLALPEGDSEQLAREHPADRVHQLVGVCIRPLWILQAVPPVVVHESKGDLVER